MSKVAIITGGARGIGLGIAEQLANAGWSLMLNGVRPQSDARLAVQQIAALGNPVDYCAADVSSSEDRKRLVEATIERFGRIDALVNNAGITSPGRKDILEADEESFDKVMGINLKGPFFLTQLAARRMAAQDNSDGWRGKVVFVSSISAEFVSVNRGDYCLTKAALGMATKLWATRLAEHHIDVYEVRPGVIRSDMTAGVTDKYDKLFSEGLTLDRRWGEPSDVGKAIRVLLDGELPYATGQVLKIDGGMTIHSL
ncbi:MAG: 3-ketoacyl-ACP reductase [Planctomycetaceae bacterium]|nr:3-ketoacyl-ACP reductase [Planctomycetaceae bacterium]